MATSSSIINCVYPCFRPDRCTDWASMANLFDLFKVTTMKIRYYPGANGVDQQIIPATGPATGVLQSYRPCYVAYDPDTSTNAGSVDAMIQYDNCKVFDLFKPFKYVIKPQIQYDNSVANAGMTVSYKKGVGMMMDIANVADYAKGIVQVYADNLAYTQFYGDVIVTYYVMFANRR
jgi:hypothetical protein